MRTGETPESDRGPNTTTPTAASSSMRYTPAIRTRQGTRQGTRQETRQGTRQGTRQEIFTESPIEGMDTDH